MQVPLQDASGDGRRRQGMSGPTKARHRLRSVLVLLLALSATLPTAPGRAAETGTLAGTLLDAGRPVAGAGVLLQTGRDPVQVATTGADGTFRADGLNPGSFSLIFALPDGGVRQWYPGRPDYDGSEPVTLTGGEVTTITNTVAPYGSIAGRVTFADGSPVPSALVTASQNPRAPVRVLTGPDGSYLVNYLQPDSYPLHFQAAEFAAPDVPADEPTTVLTGQRTTADEQFPPLGTISGRLTGEAAQIARADVTTEAADPDGTSVAATTAVDGSFRIFVYPGRYRLHFQPADDIEQWAHGSATAAGAAVLAVAEGQDVRVEEPLLPRGTLAGRLLDADGLAQAGYAIEAFEQTSGQRRVAYTDSDGSWSVSALPGRYLVRENASARVQWLRRAASPLDASAVTVRAGSTTTADDRLLPAGSLTVTPTDAGTGGAVTGFCVNLSDGYETRYTCTDESRLVLDGLSPFTFRLELTAAGHPASVSQVRVRAGRSTEARPALLPGGKVTATLRDAGTGAAVPACVTVFAVQSAPDIFNRAECGDGTAPVTVGGLPAGRFVVFVGPTDDVHGAQWVGPAGGTGDRAQARVVTLATGGSAALTARLDPAGSISGTVTAAATGERLESVLVQVGAEQALTAFTGDGAYRLDGLGPYRWPLKFRSDALGAQWSGNSPTPAGAVPVPVRARRVTTADAALQTPTTVTGTVTGADGHAPDWGWISAWDADSLQYLAAGSLQDGRYTIPVLGPNRIRLTYQAGFLGSVLTSEVWIDCTLAIPRSGTVTHPLVLPQQIAP